MATKKSPRKPKLVKYPKKPRASATTLTLERYQVKVKTIDEENRSRIKNWEREIKAWEDDKKKHAHLLHNISGMGNHLEGLRSKTPGRRRR